MNVYYLSILSFLKTLFPKIKPKAELLWSNSHAKFLGSYVGRAFKEIGIQKALRKIWRIHKVSTLGGRKFVVNANYLTWKIEKEENYHNPTTLLQPQLIFGCISPVLLFFLHGVIVVIHGHYCTYRFLPFLMCYYSSFMKLTIYISFCVPYKTVTLSLWSFNLVVNSLLCL